MGSRFVKLVSNHQFEAAAEQLQSGVDVDSIVDGGTALHYVARTSLKAVQWLIKQQADLDCLDQNGCTPLMVACVKGGKLCEKIAVTLMEARANVTVRRKKDMLSAIELAAKNSSPQLIQKLIDNGALVNAPPAGKQTAAMIACRWDNLEVFKVLLKNGADLDRKCLSDWAKQLNCRQIAEQEKSKKVLGYILSKY